MQDKKQKGRHHRRSVQSGHVRDAETWVHDDALFHPVAVVPVRALFAHHVACHEGLLDQRIDLRAKDLEHEQSGSAVRLGG